jgi:hypothetical protein
MVHGFSAESSSSVTSALPGASHCLRWPESFFKQHSLLLVAILRSHYCAGVGGTDSINTILGIISTLSPINPSALDKLKKNTGSPSNLTAGSDRYRFERQTINGNRAIYIDNGKVTYSHGTQHFTQLRMTSVSRKKGE